MKEIVQMIDDHVAVKGPSPLLPTPEETELLKRILLLSDEDEYALHQAWRVLSGQTDDYLDTLVGLAAAHPVLSQTLTGLYGDQGNYSEAVRKAFRQWLFDTCICPNEPQWIKLYYNSGMEQKPVIGFRYIPALIYPLLATLRPFLTDGARNADEAERMYQSLLKSLLLQASLASKACVENDQW